MHSSADSRSPATQVYSGCLCAAEFRRLRHNRPYLSGGEYCQKQPRCSLLDQQRVSMGEAGRLTAEGGSTVRLTFSFHGAPVGSHCSRITSGQERQLPKQVYILGSASAPSKPWQSLLEGQQQRYNLPFTVTSRWDSVHRTAS